MANKKRKHLKKIKHSHLVAGLIIIAITYLGIYQNCAGTHERSSDFSISQGQVDTYIQDVECFAQSNSALDSASSVTSLASLDSQTGTENFYGEAPSSMGEVDVVAPLQYAQLRPDGGGNPQQVFAFFSLSASGAATLVIAVSDASAVAPGTSPTPIPTATPAVLSQIRSHTIKDATDGTTSPASCSTSNALNLTTVISAQSDGTSQPTYDNDVFQVTLTLDNTGTQLLLTSYDVEDGSLQDTIQLQLSEIDPTSGQEIYLGDINLTQPD